MFGNIVIDYNEKKDIYNIKGFYGAYFRELVDKALSSKKKSKYLFISLSNNSIEFYGFLALEVAGMLEWIISFPDNHVNMATIENAYNYINTETWIKDLEKDFKDDFDYNIIKEKMNFKILEHQEKWFKEYKNIKGRLHYRGALMDVFAGGGKTSISLFTVELVKAKKVLIISPLPAVDSVWGDTLTNTIYKEPQAYYNVKSKKPYNHERFIICHYEAMGKIDHIIKEIKGKDTAIIIDESHNMNESKSNRTGALLKICNDIDSDNILLLSGTPIKASPRELAPIIEILDKRFNSSVKKRFIGLYKNTSGVLRKTIKERYNAYRVSIVKDEAVLQPVRTEEVNVKIPNGKDYTLKEISKKMKKYYDEREKELNKDYEQYENTYLNLYNKAKLICLDHKVDPKEFDIYERDVKIIRTAYRNKALPTVNENISRANKFEKDVIIPVLHGQDKKDFREAKTIYKYLKLKIVGEVLGNVVGRERINAHVDLANSIDYVKLVNSTTKKTVIFSNNVEVSEAAYNVVDSIGYKPLRVYGDYVKDLTNTVDQFMIPDNDLNPLVTTYKNLSTAVPLIVANVMITIGLPFRSYQYTQTIARLQRIGQDMPIVIYQVNLDTGDVPNINSRGVDIVNWSAEMVSIITGDELTIEQLKKSSDMEEVTSMEDMFKEIKYELPQVEEPTVINYNEDIFHTW